MVECAVAAEVGAVTMQQVPLSVRLYLLLLQCKWRIEVMGAIVLVHICYHATNW